MKKSIIVLLALFYLIITSGLTISMHYCGGKLKEISFFSTGNEEGCCGSKKKSKGCCNDKSAFIKVKDNHHASHLLKSPAPSSKLLIDVALPVFQYNFSKRDMSEIVLNYHAPPVWYDNPIYLKHRVLII
jgi:hypothetical protein